MSSRYTTGEMVIKNRKIPRFKLLDYVKKGLRPYEKETGKIINCPSKYNLKIQLDGIIEWIEKLEHPNFPKNLSHWEQERVSCYDTTEMFLYELEQAKIKYTQQMELLENKTGNKSWSWFYFDDRCPGKDIGKIVNKLVDSYFLKDDVSKIIPSNKKLLPCQRHKEACRKVAGGIWKKKPDLTIVDMIKRLERIKECEAKKYKGKHTIRNWIKDLCPNRKGGRRKGT